MGVLHITAGCHNECSYISHHRNVKHYITDNARPYPSHELVKPGRRGEVRAPAGNFRENILRFLTKWSRSLVTGGFNAVTLTSSFLCLCLNQGIITIFMRHLRAIFYFKQGIFYKFYPQENIIRQPAKLHPPTQHWILKIKMQLHSQTTKGHFKTSFKILNKYIAYHLYHVSEVFLG